MLGPFRPINPVCDRKKPHYDSVKGEFVFPVVKRYRYYVEVAQDSDIGGREYYLLMSTEKFDENCRICQTDGYRRCRVRVQGELKEFIISETKDRGNLECEYEESYENYDAFAIR